MGFYWSYTSCLFLCALDVSKYLGMVMNDETNFVRIEYISNSWALHACTPIQEFLEDEKKNNEEKENTLNTAERQAAKLRLEYQDTETARIQFKDEVYTLHEQSTNHISLIKQA